MRVGTHSEPQNSHVKDPSVIIKSLSMERKVVRIEFGLLHVRYLWPVLWPQYPSPETRPRLQNPLGLS